MEYPVAKITDLLKRAINAELYIDELESQWEKLGFVSENGNTVLNDLREGVKHTPGFLFSGKIDFKMWNSQEEFAVLVCDYLLMPYFDDPLKWKKLRTQVLDEAEGHTYEQIEASVKKALA